MLAIYRFRTQKAPGKQVRIMRMVRNLCLLGLVVLFGGCSQVPNDEVHSKEVADYDQWVKNQNPQAMLKKLHARAMELYVLGGEDIEELAQSTLALLKRLGDAEFAKEIGLLSSDERSAVRLFILPEDLGIKPDRPQGNYPLSAKAISSAVKKTDWPSLVVDKENGGEVDKW